MPDPAVQSAIAAGRVPDNVSEAYLNESRDEGTIIAIGVVCALATVILSARILARTFILKRVGLDDGLAVFSWMLFIAFVGFCILLIKLGSGRHFDYIQYVLDLPTVNATEIYDFVAHIIYTLSLLFCRLSGLALYANIANNHRSYIVAIRVIAGFIIVVSLLQLFLIIFHCTPVTGLWPYAWQPEVNNYTCLQWGLVYSVNSAVSLVNDLLLYGIPTYMIWRLAMSRKRKVQLACILLPGVLVIAISVARLVLVIKGQWDPDESWQYDPMLAVETSEIGFTIISLSIPGCKLIFDKFVKGQSAAPTTALYGDRSRKSSLGYTMQTMSSSSYQPPGAQDYDREPKRESRDSSALAGSNKPLADDRDSTADTANSNSANRDREEILVSTEYKVESVSSDKLGDTSLESGLRWNQSGQGPHGGGKVG